MNDEMDKINCLKYPTLVHDLIIDQNTLSKGHINESQTVFLSSKRIYKMYERTISIISIG